MAPVTQKESEYIAVIQEVLAAGVVLPELPEDLQQEMRSGTHKGLWGYCRCASEALLSFLGYDDYDLMFCRHVPGAKGKFRGHYWLRRKSDGFIVDPTDDQFEDNPKSVYEKGKRSKPKKVQDEATECLVRCVKKRSENAN